MCHQSCGTIEFSPQGGGGAARALNHGDARDGGGPHWWHWFCGGTTVVCYVDRIHYRWPHGAVFSQNLPGWTAEAPSKFVPSVPQRGVLRTIRAGGHGSRCWQGRGQWATRTASVVGEASSRQGLEHREGDRGDLDPWMTYPGPHQLWAAVD